MMILQVLLSVVFVIFWYSLYWTVCLNLRFSNFSMLNVFKMTIWYFFWEHQLCGTALYFLLCTFASFYVSSFLRSHVRSLTKQILKKTWKQNQKAKTSREKITKEIAKKGKRNKQLVYLQKIQEKFNKKANDPRHFLQIK